LDAITVGTTRKELSIIPLRDLLVARPKPPEQEAIALKIQKLEADLAGLEALISKFKLLKNGLMEDLLTGRVPVTPLLANPKAEISS
jgi:type I restriction enzyme S subunit